MTSKTGKTDEGRTFFSFRAEAQVDLDSLLRLLNRARIKVSIIEVRPQNHAGDRRDFCDDLRVCLYAKCTLNAIRNIAGQVDDGHVMVQTMRDCLLRDNSLERDFDYQFHGRQVRAIDKKPFST